MVFRDGEPKQIGALHMQDTADYAEPLLGVDDLTIRFDVKRNLFGRATHRVHAVENVSFDIFPGETLALVGESGSGKSTIGLAVQQLLAPTSGDIRYRGKPVSKMRAAEIAFLKEKVQYIFQDPFAALDPRKTVGFSIAEPIRTHHLIEGEANIRKRVEELLDQVGLESRHADRFPHEFSGGQRQRVCIARALAPEPELIIADEVLSALDVSIQAQIIDLFLELQERFRLSYLFISHDVAVVERMSHRIAVLYLGQIMELGTRDAVLNHPQHAYTRRLLAAVPRSEPGHRPDARLIEGEIPSPIRKAGDLPDIISLNEFSPGHFVADKDGGMTRRSRQPTSV